MSISAVSNAQVFHAIIACNTIDKSVGAYMADELTNVSDMVQTIAAALDCELDFQTFDGYTCTRDNVTQYINEMDVDKDDVVLFYYGGHGGRAKDNEDDPWPQMCMNADISSESLFLPAARVERLIAEKSPRLRIILTGCCNSEDARISIKPLYAEGPAGPTILGDYDAEAYKKLFLEAKGKVMMTSSKRGTVSAACSGGSFFSIALLSTLDAVGMNNVNPDWNAVCEDVKGNASQIAASYSRTQEAYYDVDVSGSGSGSGGGVVPPVPSTDNLFKALQTLVNHDYTVDERLDKMASVKSKYFTSDAHVITVGRDGKTRVMYEEVGDFLRRLALSKNIKQINVLEGSDGNNSLITVHEVRY